MDHALVIPESWRQPSPNSDGSASPGPGGTCGAARSTSPRPAGFRVSPSVFGSSCHGRTFYRAADISRVDSAANSNSDRQAGDELAEILLWLAPQDDASLKDRLAFFARPYLLFTTLSACSRVGQCRSRHRAGARRGEAQRRSRLVAASDGKILWGFLAADEKWRLSIAEADVDPQYLSMLIAYEDQRFRNHHGIDAAALIRAAL